jgi:hypothetical protein
MGERMGRIGQMNTDFLVLRSILIHVQKKKIRVNQPNPPNPFSHRITIVSQHSEIRNPHSEIIITVLLKNLNLKVSWVKSESQELGWELC